MDSITVKRGSLSYVFEETKVKKLDYLSNALKVVILVLIFGLVSLVITLTFSRVIITTGVLPGLIIYALLVGPIQNRIANRRRSNTSFSPRTRAELSFSDIAEVKIKGRDVTLKGKKVKLSFRATKQEADSIASFLQQRLDSKLLSVR